MNEVALRRARLALGWVTVFGRISHLQYATSRSGQLSLIPSAGRDVKYRPKCGDAVRMCGWQAKVKLCDS